MIPSSTAVQLKWLPPSFRRRLSRCATGRALILLLMQLALFSLLAAILILVLAVNTGARRASYALLVLALTAALSAAIGLNLRGRYGASVWVTVLETAAAPWASLAIDPNILGGDLIPLVYTVMSIHLCATFLGGWITCGVALAQLAGVAALIALNPGCASVNWPSLLAYIACAAVIGTTTSAVTRRHVAQIEAQNRALRESEAQLRVLSTRDPLTGQYNRRYMEETLEREIDRVRRKGLPLGLMIADLNDFKEINDTHGHMAGDSVLRSIARILGDFARKSDVVCRFGGDEFVMIFPECGREAVEARRDEIARALRDAGPGGDMGRVTMSFGIAMLPRDGVTAPQLLRAADEALYASKKQKPKAAAGDNP